MRFELELNVLWHTDEGQTLADAGLEVDKQYTTVKAHTFYSIENIRPYEDDECKNYCKLSSGGVQYIVNESYEVVKQKIKDVMNFKWN